MGRGEVNSPENLLHLISSLSTPERTQLQGFGGHLSLESKNNM